MFKRGTLVRYTGEFLRSICWHTPPINGIAGRTTELPSGAKLVSVLWCDRDEAVNVLECNLEVTPEDAQVSDSYREILLDTYKM